MELKSGYKQTEVGVIPSDWEVKKIGEFAEVKTGNTPPTNDRSNYGDEFFFVSPSDLGKGKYIIDTEKKLSFKGFGISRVFPKNSILFTCIGSTIGKSGISNRELSSNQQINAVLPNGNYVTDFVFYSLSLFSPSIKASASEQAVPLINKTQFETTLIPFPPTLAEQTAIATALSYTDQYITHLEKLIAKKRNIKQGAMQELLKPKEGWVVKNLGDIADLIKESIFPINFPTTDFSHFSLPAFDEGGMPTFESGATILSNKFKVPKDAILVAKLNPRIPRVWMPIRVPENAIASTEFLVLVVKKFVTREYLYTVCKSSYFFKQMELAVTGTTGSHQRINPNDAMQIEVCFPPSVENQTRIANTISDMDSEITTLESKLSKAQSIKQGMMQQLLTGKIRLT